MNTRWYSMTRGQVLIMKIAVITDSGANLETSYMNEKNNLYVVPLMIVIDGKTYKDQIEISSSEVYEKLDTNHVSTSLPDKVDIMNAIQAVKNGQYDHVIVISISSGLSGTFNQFRLVLEDQDVPYTHIDTKTLGYQQGFMVKRAIELIEKGHSPKDIEENLARFRKEDSLAMYTINTLKYLKKGGRIGKVEGTIGELLKIKPVITVNDDGVYVTLSKGIGISRSLLTMKDILVKKFDTDLIDLTIHYGADLEKATQLGQTLQKSLNVRHLVISELTPVLGIHTGPDMFAYVAARVK